MEDGRGRRISVLADARRYDVVVPPGTRVADVLSTLGIGHARSPLAMATPSGHVLGMRDVLDEHLREGAVVTVVRSTTHEVVRGVVNLAPSHVVGARAPEGVGGRSGAVVEDTVSRGRLDERTVRRTDLASGPAPETGPDGGRHGRRRRGGRGIPAGATSLVAPDPLLPVVVGGAALALALELAVVLSGAGPAPDGWPGIATGLAMLAAALLLATRRGDTHSARTARLTAPVVAFAGGLALPPTVTSGIPGVALVAACTLGAVAAGVARVAAGERDGGSRTAVVALSGLGLLGVAGVLLDWPAAAVGALAAGVTPLVVRLLPSLGLEMPDEQLVDVERLSTTIWSVREQRRPRRRRIRSEDIGLRFRRARDVVAAGTVWAGVVAPAGTFVVLARPPEGTTARVGGLVLCGVLAVAMGYQSRSLRDRLPRFALLLSSTALVFELTWAVVTRSGGPTTTLLVVGLVVLGMLVVAGAAALEHGWTSPRLSRLADLLESLAVVLALPAALVAADGLEALRRLTSG